MSAVEKFEESVNVPSTAELATSYLHYRPFAEGAGKDLFELLTSPLQHLKARIATEDLNLPAVAGIARDCELYSEQTATELSRFIKQFIGAVVCVSMEANGFKKTGIKRSIPHPAFNKGEFYARNEAVQSGMRRKDEQADHKLSNREPIPTVSSVG